MTTPRMDGRRPSPEAWVSRDTPRVASTAPGAVAPLRFLVRFIRATPSTTDAPPALAEREPGASTVRSTFRCQQSQPASNKRPRFGYLPAVIALCGVLLLGLASCGSSSSPAASNTGQPVPSSGSGSSGSGNTGSSTLSAAPECDSFCQQAGPPSGTFDAGCPDNNMAKCIPCPTGGCMTVQTISAGVRGNVTNITARCGARPCSGAFQLYEPGHEPGNPMAASNFSIPANQTSTFAVAVTNLGQQLAAMPGGSVADIWVFLHGSGDLGGGAPIGQLKLHD
jgi:hypothetical protein